MARNENPEAPLSIHETLSGLIGDALDQHADLSDADLRTAGAVVAATVDAIEEEILLVEPPDDPEPPDLPVESDQDSNGERAHKYPPF